MKKINELSLNEAKEAKEKIKILIERVKVQKNKILNEIEIHRSKLKKIKEEKRNKMKEMQNQINKASTKSLKDSKRKSKESTSKGFDSQIKTYNTKISNLKNDFTGKNDEISKFRILLSQINIHINNIK